MPTELKKTNIRRAHKAKKAGKRNKAARRNQGSTAKFPLTGAIPALRFGMLVDAESIVVPANLR